MSSEPSSRSKFFRQSGWMVSATLAGGICMFAVHIVAPRLGDKEYGLFGTLLAMLNVPMIPALGLQTTIAHLAAAAVTPEAQARLTSTVRSVMWWTFLFWLGFAVLAAAFQLQIIELLTITNPLALWLVVLLTLCLLWQPILFGMLQGRQNFLWLGWSLITNGMGRLLAVMFIVFVLGGLATGGIGGALIGVALSVLLAGYHTRMVWAGGQRSEFDWKGLLHQVVPLTLGLGAFQFIFSVDMLLVRALYGEYQTGLYSASGMIGRGLVMFTAPLAVVMYPKIVHSKATGKKSNVLLYTLASVAALGIAAAAGCTFAAHLMQQTVASPDFAPFYLPTKLLAKLRQYPAVTIQALAHLIPWFVWCMLPLALGNVLLNNLLARKQYRVVPYLLVVVAAYAATAVQLAILNPGPERYLAFTRIIQVLGAASLVFLGVCGLFTVWCGRDSKETGNDQSQ